MTLGHPWGLAGLALLAVPAIVHLLGRRRARVVKFPSLRFVAASRLTPARRTRPTDLMLLIVRMAIVAAAVVALAQPRFDTAGRRAARDRSLEHLIARAIVVDTSASMRRLAPSGESGLSIARREAMRLAGEATTKEVIETPAPTHVLAGASQWLLNQTGRRELVVISDFQLGTIDSTAIGAVAPAIGIAFVRVDVHAAGGAIQTQISNRVARITPSPDRTTVEWSARVESPVAVWNPVLLTGAPDSSRAEAARMAAMAVGRLSAQDSSRPVAVIYNGFGRRDELARAATAIDQPWMGDVVTQLSGDVTLVTAASTADVADTSSYGPRFTVVARNTARRPVVLASRGDVGGRPGLQLWVLADAGSLTSAAVIAGLSDAISVAAPVEELEPRSLPREVVARWERPASPASPRTDGTDESDGRWFWLAVLILLGVESLVRRGSPARPTPMVAVPLQSDDKVQHVA